MSSIDGRYAGKTRQLSPVFSEFGLIQRRMLVEIRWFQCLAGNQDIDSVAPLTVADNGWLDQLAADFSVEDAARVKTIEATTNHDVKAVEYFLKERFAARENLASLSEFLHFACTSEDINNLAYGLMLHDARQQVILPALLSNADIARYSRPALGREQDASGHADALRSPRRVDDRHAQRDNSH